MSRFFYSHNIQSHARIITELFLSHLAKQKICAFWDCLGGHYNASCLLEYDTVYVLKFRRNLLPPSSEKDSRWRRENSCTHMEFKGLNRECKRIILNWFRQKNENWSEDYKHMFIKCAHISNIYYHATEVHKSWVSGRHGHSILYSIL
jgi:hypothetical protein